METMQLQPVKANIIYPNRANRNIIPMNHALIEEAIEVIEPIGSRRDENRLPFIEANTISTAAKMRTLPIFSK